MKKKVFPIDTVVRFKSTGVFAIIKQQTFLLDNDSLLYYLGWIEGRGNDIYCIMPDDIELECLPPDRNDTQSPDHP